MLSIPRFTSSTSSPASKSEAVAALQARVDQLAKVNQELQDALHAAHTGSILMQGYLTKHRPVSQLTGLFAQEWELRYFILTGAVLRYYKSERDAAAFTPRGVVDVQGCYIELEESGDSRPWRFRIIEPGGNLLLRLGTDNRATAERWLSCLESVGLQVLSPGEHLPSRTVTSAGSGAAMSGETASGTTGVKDQERWEACSTDSELPEVSNALARTTAAAAAPRPPRPPGRQQAHPSTAAAAAAAAVAEATTRGAHGVGVSCYQITEDEATSQPARTAATAEKPGPRGHGSRQGVTSTSGASRPPMVGSTPVHTVARYSYLSSDGVWTAKHDGLLNLGIIILVATNFRLILENLLKYGWRLNFISYVSRSLSGSGNLPLVLAFPALVLFCVVALCTEKLGVFCLKVEEQCRAAASKKSDDDDGTDVDSKAVIRAYQARILQTETIVFVLNAVNTTAALLLPCFVIHWTQADAAPGFLLTLCTLVVWMKLISYAHCHHDLRAAHRANLLRPGERGAPESDPVWAKLRYPENLTLLNMMYFLAVPTLTYQVNFPRSNRIRKRWLMRRVVELACFSGLLLFMANQYLEPAVSNAVLPLSQSDWVRVLERVLKLALPMLYCWLCIFYCLFHLFLNITAELTRFGDREFYKDWWNAATIGEYWKLWNMPVHKWLLRTIYFPAMRAGLGRYWSLVLVFFVSAVAHEVMVGVPLHMVKFWSFAGIMLQVPLISLTENLRKRLKSETWGNYIFWVTFCMVGQPMSLLMYYHDYVYANADHGKPALITAVAGGDYLRDA